MLSQEAFARMVSDDVKQRSTPEQQAYLNLPEVAPLHVEELKTLLASLADQIAQLEEQFERHTAAHQMGNGSSRSELVAWQSAQQERISKVKKFEKHVKKRLEKVTGNEVQSFPSLYQAIRKHKANIKAGTPHEQADMVLWGHIET